MKKSTFRKIENLCFNEVLVLATSRIILVYKWRNIVKPPSPSHQPPLTQHTNVELQWLEH